MHRHRFLIAALVLALVSAGCGADGPQQTTAYSAVPVPEPELEVVLRQYRRDQALRRVQVTVTNRGDTVLEVRSVALEVPGYAAVPPAPRDAEIAPGARVDLPVALGEARCAEVAAQSAGQAVALARVAAPGGGERDVEVALPSPHELLDRLLTRECGQLALAGAMSVTFSPTWTPAEVDGQRTLHGSLAVRRLASSEPLTVSGVAGSVIFSLRALDGSRSPLLVLDPGQASGEIPIEVTAARCDPHALADSKRTFAFPLWAALADGDELATAVSVDEAARMRLEELIRTGCGL